MEKEFTQEHIDRALLDPSLEFENPIAVVKAANIDRATRIEILRRWEYDARELQVEEEESPATTSTSNLLSEVLDALHQLGAEPELEDAPPTKHG